MEITKFFKLLADETRLRIIRLLLNGTFNVSEVLFIVNGKQSNISHHLKTLYEAGLITSKREGSQIYYTFNTMLKPESLFNIVHELQKNTELINNYLDDAKRLEMILQKRKKKAESFFNTIGENLDDVQSKLFDHIYSTEDAVRIFNNKNFSEIIDIGCGTGKNLPLLAKYADRVIGLDSSPLMLQLAEHICKKNNLHYDLKQGDIEHLPLNDNTAECIFINMVLHHISEPQQALQEFARVLKNSGKLLLIELLSHQNEVFREKYADLWLGFDLAELKKWLNNANFTITNEIIRASDNIDKKNKTYRVAILYCELND